MRVRRMERKFMVHWLLVENIELELGECGGEEKMRMSQVDTKSVLLVVECFWCEG